MAVDSQHFEESLLRNLKLEDPWLPPKPWESIPSESGRSFSLSSSKNHTASSRDSLYDLSSVSEASVVRLVMNALQGVESAVVCIEQLSALFCADPADRSTHRIPTLWNRSLSTCALGRMLKSIGFSGCLVVLLQKFVDHFTYFGESTATKQQADNVAADGNIDEGRTTEHHSHSLVNQAFAVAVRKVLEGYLCALDTLNASVHVRRSCDNVNLHSTDARRSCDNVNLHSKYSQWQGSLTDVAHSELTLLEIYLHTKELRTQIEVLGHLCSLHDAALCYSLISFEELTAKAVVKFHDFPRGASLLTYLYRQLQVVDPAHCTLLKYLFLRSLEPYCGFIRSWIYEAKIDDPYGEFIVGYSHGKAEISVDFPLAALREQDEVAVPCFLKSVSVPLLRAGQQLQVVMRLLQLCNYAHAGEYTFEDILPGLRNLPSDKVSCSPLSFNKGEIVAAALARRSFYNKMHEKLENFMDSLHIKYRQVVLHGATTVYASTGETGQSSPLEKTLTSITDMEDLHQALQNKDSDASSVDEDISFPSDPWESSECSSTDDFEDRADSAISLDLHDNLASSKQRHLSALCFSTVSSEKGLAESPQTEKLLCVQHDLTDSSTGETSLRNHGASCKEPMDLSGSWLSGIQYAGGVPDLGWPLGGLLGNPLSAGQKCRDEGGFQVTGSDPDMIASSGQVLEEALSCSSDQSASGDGLMHELPEGYECSSSNSFLIQSWNAKYPCNVLSMNPMFTKNAFINDVSQPGENQSKFSKSFPCFDFSSTRDPFKVDEGMLPDGQKNNIRTESSRLNGISAVCSAEFYGTTHSDAGDIPLDKEHMDHGGTCLNLRSEKIDAHMQQPTGGSSWQSLLHGSVSTGVATITESEHSSESIFPIPLDFVIDNCLLQEILLQYIYVSRLSIKLLEEGFDLLEHFLALRRYNFMEVADWADLFITSLWHHKWHFMEADQNIPEIQGLLESSIQRSSCERDRNKDRLYVYVKDQESAPLSIAQVGIHSFDFIGLGYRVDWPVSIVLTPNALRMYAKIFTFLIQVKLAVLSLSDVWCSLKGFRHEFSQSSQQPEMARINFNYLVKLRHQVNHFVFTLQQYVLSQLSHVAWCKFLYALKHEVKDLMDLESVHMAYLTESKHICFLSDETQAISNNIESILQCALDFRSCLVKGIEDVRLNDKISAPSISQINVSQVLSLKEKFYKNLKELHLSYLKSPKHGEFGLPRFWSYLNYNGFYSNSFDNEICHYNLLVQ